MGTLVGRSKGVGVRDKGGILEHLRSRARVVLELGCGDRKRDPSWIGIDVRDHEGVDIVGDVGEVLRRFPDASVEEVHSFHFLEHVPDLAGLLAELGRVVKTAGVMELVVPHFSNPYYYSDYTHRNFFGLYSFSYLADDGILRRRVPRYVEESAFELLSVDLSFKSTPPFYVRHVFKRAIGFLINSSRYTKELYEESFCHLFPCYEIRFLLRRK